MDLNKLWQEGSKSDWNKALKTYDEQADELDRQLEACKSSEIKRMSAQRFYEFLYNEYAEWKYGNDKARLKRTRNLLIKYYPERIQYLEIVKECIFCAYRISPNDTETLLEIVTRIKGLGVAGASGLLSILFPLNYGTLDRHLVNSLRKISGLPEHEILEEMTPDGLTIKDGIVLESILRNKANELNIKFSTSKWTPRKIDKILYIADKEAPMKNEQTY